MNTKDLLEIYLDQRAHRLSGSIYHKTQCELAYNSNRIEGSKLSEDQTRMLFDRQYFSGDAPLDDILEAKNHFVAFDYILDHTNDALSDAFLCELHKILKEGTAQANNPLYSVGSYKLFENEIGELDQTCPAKETPEVMAHLIDEYEHKKHHGLEDIIDFHARFEKIHPFSDGNGRVGRLVMFKESLRHNIIPFIITDEMREFYIRGLQKYSEESGWLVDTCKNAQDHFIAKSLPLAQSYLDAKNNLR